jgi:hypothetical protein
MGDNLNVVRSNVARPWTWTNHFSSGNTDAAAPSTTSLDLLNSILSSSDDSIKQKLASPPLWSTLSLNISFTPQLPKGRRPRIKKLIFKATTSTWAAPTTQRVLDVRCVGAKVDLTCSPADLDGRGNGFGNIYRIYSSKASVKLTAPAVFGNKNFSRWKVVDNDASRIYEKESITLQLNSHTLVYCYYEADDEGVEEVAVTSLESAKLEKLAVAEAGKDKNLMTNINRFLESQAAPASKPAKNTSRKKAAKGKSSASTAAKQTADNTALIRIAPKASAQVVGSSSDSDDVTVLESQDGWRKVMVGSVVGYSKE